MTLAYASILGLRVYRINVKAQKIDCSILKTFEIVLASFYIENKLKKSWFLFADLSIKIVLRMSFLILSNANN